jgi:general secretion pathway protein N
LTGKPANNIGRRAGTERQAPRVVAYALLGVAAFAVFLIVRAPAPLISTALERASHGAITIGAATGTVWRGSGQLVARQTPQAPVLIGRVTWTVNPLWFFAGKIGLGVTVSGGDADIAGHIRAGFSSVILQGVKGVFPARLVPVLYAPAELLGPDGRVEISAPDLRWSRKSGITGAAEIHWRDAVSSLTTVRPLGDYRLSLEEGGALKLDTLRGDLRLTGHGMLDNTIGGARFSGQASAANRVSELAEVLKLMGPGPDAGPRPFHFEFSLRN